MRDYYIYKHFRKDTKELFYIGLGRNNRAYQTNGRNKLWTNIYKKHGRIVEISNKYLCLKEAEILEIALIKKWGKLVDGSGILSNISDGGDDIWNRGLCKDKQPRTNKKNSDHQKKIVSEMMKNNNPMKNEDVKSKVRQKKIGVKWCDEHKGKKKVIVFKNDEFFAIFNSKKEASDKLNLNYSSVGKILDGSRNSLYGYKLKYII